MDVTAITLNTQVWTGVLGGLAAIYAAIRYVYFVPGLSPTAPCCGTRASGWKGRWKYLMGPYNAGPNFTPAPLTPALITPVSKIPFSPFRAGVKRAARYIY